MALDSFRSINLSRLFVEPRGARLRRRTPPHQFRPAPQHVFSQARRLIVRVMNGRKTGVKGFSRGTATKTATIDRAGAIHDLMP
jgi:hypothetical protein